MTEIAGSLEHPETPTHTNKITNLGGGVVLPDTFIERVNALAGDRVGA